MARVAPPPRSPDGMTANQRARRVRVLDAVLGMIAEGGVDEVGMRELAERSGVALGTVYRYFSSKDHVVAAALVEWAGHYRDRMGRGKLPEGPLADRLKAVLRQGMRAFQREPEFARLLIRSATSHDPFASECYRQQGDIVRGVMADAIAELPADERGRVLQVVGAVWYVALVEWVNGRATVAQVNERLDTACDLTLGWRDARSDARKEQA